MNNDNACTAADVLAVISYINSDNAYAKGLAAASPTIDALF